MLRRKVRTDEKPYHPRTSASVDSQSIVRRPEGSEGWSKLTIRWTVERAFAWLGKSRRLTKDREKSVLSSESLIKLAMIPLTFHRRHPSDADTEFHDRNVD